MTLRSTEEALALGLHARFGDALDIKVGRHRFPFSTTPTAPPARPTSTLEIPGLQIGVEPEHDSWQPGETIRGVLRISNTSTNDSIRFTTGNPAHGMLVDSTGTPVASHTGATRGTGRRIDLTPGDTTTIRFISGSDTFDPTNGPTLQPGAYLLILRVRIRTENTTEQDLLVTPPVRVEIDHP